VLCACVLMTVLFLCSCVHGRRACVRCVLGRGAALETTGLFQEAGPKKDVKELVKRIEAKQDIEWAKIKNPHTVSSTPTLSLLVACAACVPRLQAHARTRRSQLCDDTARD
jgi:hypothetical protein